MKNIFLTSLALSSLVLTGCISSDSADDHTHGHEHHQAHSTASHDHDHYVDYNKTCGGMADVIVINWAGDLSAVTITDEGSSYSTLYWNDHESLRIELVSDFSGHCTKYEWVYKGLSGPALRRGY